MEEIRCDVTRLKYQQADTAYIHFNGHFPGKPNPASYSSIFSLQLSWKGMFRDMLNGLFLQARCSSSYLT